MSSKSAYLKSCGILAKWHDKTFSDFVNDPEALEKVKSYLNNHKKLRKKGIGLYLYGANGVGKTLLMNLAFRHLLDEHSYRIQIISLSTLISMHARGWYSEEIQEMYETIINAEFLGIEEIGKEFKSGDSALAKTVLDSILRYRVQSLLPTWCTSNLPASGLKEHYTQDIASMLRESCIPVHVLGEDYRIKIAKTLPDNL